MTSRPTTTLTAILLASCLPASAVIVAGARGGAGAELNIDGAGMQSATGTPAAIFDNLITYEDSSGIYLGHTPGGSDVWVLTARHVWEGGTDDDVVIDGLTYTWQQRYSNPSPTLDWELNRYSRGDSLVPSLNSIQLATSTPTIGTPITVIGRGRGRTEIATTSATVGDDTSTGVGTGYHWDTAASQDMRWGTNDTAASFADAGSGWTGGNTTEYLSGYGTVFFSNFDEPASGEWLTSNEMSTAFGDSGGGVFTLEGDEWVLGGINTTASTFSGQDVDSSAFGNSALYLDIATYRSDILGITGTLIPEPGAISSLLPALALLFRRRRRL